MLQFTRFPNSRITRATGALAALLLAVVTPPAGAQTLTLDNDIQTHATLTGTNVTVIGNSELRITGTGNPISGSIINLVGTDAWLRFTALRPSAVNSSLLGQIRINGANAVLNTNCRITQFGDGAVVIPHGSGFRPLEIFDGPSYTGESSSLLPYVAYSDANLGLANRVSSFRLKRGYTMTIAQNPNGTGVSRNYVAQDGDLEVALLPTGLDDAASFIRIFPWRWSTKKGIAGNIESGLNVSWGYNWNIDRNSSLDWEYVPIRQERWWPGLGQNWQARGASHLLGYNEPNSADQSNIAVGDALWSWPDLLGTGLRVGSPAPTDGGLGWLYDFMDGADAENKRVDFVAVHYYRCFNPSNPQGAATQMYNFLKGVHDRTGRPIWVTEWNNGANWTGCGDPNYDQQALAIQAMMDMMEAAPFVERYALYNWVEDVRRVKWDDGSLTTAGVVYRDKPSALAYTQVLPDVATAPSAYYPFENDVRDASPSGHTAMTRGAATFATGKASRGLSMSGNASSGDHVLLPPRLGDSTDFTFGAWVKWNGGGNWQRIVDLGNGDTQKYLFLTPSADNGKVRFAIKNGGGEQQLNSTAPMAINTWTHVAATISGNTGKLFINGSPVATNNSMTINPVDLGTTTNYLGKSQFANDPLFAGMLDEVQILDSALSDAQVMAMATNVPPQFTSDPIDGGSATQGVAYSGSLAGSASDPGDTLTFSKLSGPEWLVVGANGALSGTPTSSDHGLQSFVVKVTDLAGASATAQLTILLPSATGTALPDVLDGVQNLSFSTSTANNTNVQYVASEYLAGDNPDALGQTFTTGTNPDGYSLSSISVRQVSWGTTAWDYTGGNVTLKVFTMDTDNGNGVWDITELAQQTIDVGEEPDGIGYSTGTPGPNARWLTVGLDSPLTLAANTMYGFMLSASGTGGNDQFFIELDGTSTSPYAGGFAITTGDINGTAVWDGNNGRPGDRAFVAAMTALGEPVEDYQTWIAGYALGGLTGFAQDADGDGIANGVENYLGTHPGVANPGIAHAERSGNTFTFQHPQNPNPASDVEASYRWTLDLSSWNASGATSDGTTVTFTASLDTPTEGTTTVTATISGTMPPRLFTDLEVLQSTP